LAKFVGGETERRIDFDWPADITAHELGRAAGLSNFADDAPAIFFVEVGDDDRGAFAGEGFGGSLSDTRSGAADQSDFAFQTHIKLSDFN
jgi:hypothetical protein